MDGNELCSIIKYAQKNCTCVGRFKGDICKKFRLTAYPLPATGHIHLTNTASPNSGNSRIERIQRKTYLVSS